jgi:hypothetical protein
LALKLVPLQAAGCASCRGQEDTPKVLCIYCGEIPDIPSEKRCETCGRVIPLSYVTIGYDINMKPDDLD